MKLIHCQWPDLKVPSGYQVISTDIKSMSALEIERVEIYIPRYMGGVSTLQEIEKFPHLTLVQLLTAGYDDALPYIRKGVRLSNARGVHDYSTAELALGLITHHIIGIRGYVADMSSWTWNDTQRDSLLGKKVAIVGAGAIGRQIEKFLSPLNIDCTFFGRSTREDIHSISELTEMIGDFDIVILILPLTKESRGLISTRELSMMKDGALLVNLARGAIVDTEALVAELKRGRISAALDVTDPEPLPSTHELWRLPNVVITPHVGGNSKAFEPQARAFCEKQLERFVATGELSNEIEI